MPNVINLQASGVAYNVKDVGMHKTVKYNGSPLPYLYKANTYFNGSSEAALDGYDLYKVPLSAGDIIYINCTDNTAPWDGLTDTYAVWVYYTGSYYLIRGANNNNKLGGTSTSGQIGALIVGVEDADFCLFSVKRTKLSVTQMWINVPYNSFVKTGDVQYTDTVTKVNTDTSISTGLLVALPPYGYINGVSSTGRVRCLHIRKDDRLVFDSLATGFSYYGVFIGPTSSSQITTGIFTAPEDGVAYVFFSAGEETGDTKITLFPKNSIKIEYDKIVGAPTTENRPLYGKTIAFFGDSITYNYLWEPFVLADVGGTGVNCGVGSSPVSGQDTDAYWQTARLSAVKTADPDVVVILGGANDLVLNPVIGTSADLASKDTDTFIGAYSYVIDDLLTWKPSLKIVILSTTWAHNDGADYSQTVTYGDFAAACKLVAEHYHLPYVDLYNESGFNAYTMNSSPYNIYSSDHIHPNVSGAKIIASMVCQKLREVFSLISAS
jgi:lysophospholipase L1-like esterase